MNNIVLHNEKSRFIGANNYLVGNYVITNDWEILEDMGKEFNAVIVNARLKVLAADYLTKVVRKSYSKDELYEEVMRESRAKYNKDKAYYWGIELLMFLDEKKQLATYFACTDVTRFAIKNVPLMMGRMVVFKSEKVEGGRFDFYKPLILPSDGVVNVDVINKLILASDAL